MGDNMDILSLGQKVKKLRKEKGMTLKDLAGNRITAAQISHIERDKSYPSQDLLEYFSQKLEVSIDYLLESKEMQAKKIAANLLLKSEILIQTGKSAEAKKELSRVLGLCLDFDISEECAKGNYLYGLMFKEDNQYKKALEMMEKALVLYIKVLSWEGAARCYLELGKIYTLNGFYDPSIHMLHQSETIIRDNKIKNLELEKEIYISIAYAYIKNNQRQESKAYAQKAENLSNKLGDFKSRGMNYYLIANNYFQSLEYDLAKKYFNMALKSFEEEKKLLEKSHTQMMLFEVYNMLGDSDEALGHIQNAYEIKKEYKDEHTVKIIFKYIDVLCKSGNLKMAKDLSKEALSISMALKDIVLECLSIRKYAIILSREGDIEGASTSLSKCVEMFEKLGDKKQLANIYFDKAKLFEGKSKEEEIKYYTKGIDLFKEIGIIEN